MKTIAVFTSEEIDVMKNHLEEALRTCSARDNFYITLALHKLESADSVVCKGQANK